VTVAADGLAASRKTPFGKKKASQVFLRIRRWIILPLRKRRHRTQLRITKSRGLTMGNIHAQAR
jgi:hypothetical protein